ncbi:hypothetical protein [Streptomyces sp. NPDC013457]|uniref:hypothetical protein n=1 Tax=Streptomyces sp. NPDC013457 TaxID=3364866 RepID=UPI0036F5D2EA
MDVVSLSDTLFDALVTATQDDLVRFAEPWSKTDELRQIRIGAEVAADVLTLFSSSRRWRVR